MARFFTFLCLTLLVAATAQRPVTKAPAKAAVAANKKPVKATAIKKPVKAAAGGSTTKAPAKATGGTTSTTVVTSGTIYTVSSTCPSRLSEGFASQAAAGNTAIVPCKVASDCTNFFVKDGFTACCMYPNCICGVAQISALAAGNGIGCLKA